MPAKENILNYIHKKYGRLLIIGEVISNDGRSKIWAKCDCGSIKVYKLKYIKEGRTQSCGCLRLELKTTHGISSHPLRAVYSGMMGRCYNPQHQAYKHYGGKGVTVCEEWREDIISFYNWAINNGWAKGLELDKDKLAPNQRGLLYSPEYCSFITQEENIQYRDCCVFLEHDGKRMNITQWSKIVGINRMTIQGRLRNGWSVDRALTEPIEVHNKKSA